ncbi:MAG: hypothetical protein Q7S61_01130 [bacterium]|nr:hypothetical protein [bacterium]
MENPRLYSEHLNSQELTRDQETYLRMQLYYFLPFVRRYYELLRISDNVDENFKKESLSHLKDIAHYYAEALIFGQLNIDLEQKKIEELFLHIGKAYHPQEFRRKMLEEINENTFNKSDGHLKDYFYGDTSCKELEHSNKLEKYPYMFTQPIGIISHSQEDRQDILFSLGNYIKQSRNTLNVSIWGNVARGIIEAAGVHTVLERMAVPAELHVYRASPYAMGDKKFVQIAEPQYTPLQWVIAVDSFSMGGPSIDMTIVMLDSLRASRKSIYLGYGGFANMRRKNLAIEYQWDKEPGNMFSTQFAVR